MSKSDITGNWTFIGDGWTDEVCAVSSTGRVLTRTTLHIPYDKGYDVKEIYGESVVQGLEKDAKKICEKMIPPVEDK